jgi:signal transduction histidine kinase
MAIHVELLRGKLARPAAVPAPVLAVGAVAGGAGPTLMTDARESSPDSSVLGHVGVIEDEIRHLDSLVGGLLKFTRPESLRLEPIDLSQLIQDVVQVIEPEADRSRVLVETAVGRDLPEVYGDRTMLHKAFFNLALNAVQAMPSGGTLRIRAWKAKDRRVAVRFEDTGIGIPPENLERIFDLYFTTKEQGSGIGLALVYRTIVLHDGEIFVESAPGQTAFTVELPMV